MTLKDYKIECTRYKCVNRGACQGYLSLNVGYWGVEIPDFVYMKSPKDGDTWISFPGKKYNNAQGEVKYQPMFRFSDKDEYVNFCKQAKECTEAFIRNNVQEQIEQSANPYESNNNYGG